MFAFRPLPISWTPPHRQDIINTTTYKNFDMIYHDFPFTKVLADWVAEGGQAWELIEPVDVRCLLPPFCRVVCGRVCRPRLL